MQADDQADSRDDATGRTEKYAGACALVLDDSFHSSSWLRAALTGTGSRPKPLLQFSHLSFTQQDRCIDRDVCGYDQPCQHQLYMPRKSGRVYYRDDVMFDEAIDVALLSGTNPENIFECC